MNMTTIKLFSVGLDQHLQINVSIRIPLPPLGVLLSYMNSPLRLYTGRDFTVQILYSKFCFKLNVDPCKVRTS